MEKLNVAIADDNEKMADMIGPVSYTHLHCTGGGQFLLFETYLG